MVILENGYDRLTLIRSRCLSSNRSIDHRLIEFELLTQLLIDFSNETGKNQAQEKFFLLECCPELSGLWPHSSSCLFWVPNEGSDIWMLPNVGKDPMYHSSMPARFSLADVILKSRQIPLEGSNT